MVLALTQLRNRRFVLWEKRLRGTDARYGGAKAAIEITSLRILAGKLPSRALGLVVEWASQHQGELMANWDAARSDSPPRKIEPLQ